MTTVVTLSSRRGWVTGDVLVCQRISVVRVNLTAMGRRGCDLKKLSSFMLSSLLAAILLNQPLDFYPEGPYDVRIPRPESILGYEPGARHTTFREQEQVVMAIAASAPERVRLIPYGKSTEGRPLRVLAVSSAANIARLDEIQKEHEQLANGKGDPSKTVPIVWVNECIHGDETASFESGMWTLYNLVASKGSLSKALDKEVVILNPVYNPDGHERYVVYYNSVATGSSDPRAFEATVPGVMRGRLNHYRFDLNRDRVAFSQEETRAEFKEMLHWNPQVYIDQHGQVESYFFPPEPMAINPNVDRARNEKWTTLFGKATAKAFDQRGFSYFTKNEFDLWYPGYLDASTTLTGAIGMTHETDGGRTLASLRADGSTLTLAHGMAKHFTSALAVVEASADHAPELLKDYAKFKSEAVKGELAGGFRNVVVTGDRRVLKRLQGQLARAGVNSDLSQLILNSAEGSIGSSQAHDYWSNTVGERFTESSSLKISMKQPQSAMAKALLEPTTEFEAQFIKEQIAKKKSAPEGEKYPGRDGTEFYDFTGWSLPLAYSLPAFWSTDLGWTGILDYAPEPKFEPSTIGYSLDYSDQDDLLAVMELLKAGVRTSVATKTMVGLGVGTFLFLNERNDESLFDRLQKARESHGAHIYPLQTAYPEQDRYSPGSSFTLALRPPSIAVVMGRSGNLAQSGFMWWLMEREFKAPFTPITEDALSDPDLNRFTCVVLPQGVQVPKDAHFKEWIEAGNVAVSLGAGADFAGLEKVKGEFQDLPGSLFRAEIDPRSFLSYGYKPNKDGKIEVAVPVQGNSFYKVKKEGGSFVTFSSDPKVKKLLSGWEWPDETEKAISGTVWCQDTPVGRGHFVLFTQDPTERALWPGLNKMLLNAMLFGSAR